MRSCSAAGGRPRLAAGEPARAKALSGQRPPARRAVPRGRPDASARWKFLFHKPGGFGAGDAGGGLLRLAGRTHILNSAVCLARGGAALFEATQSARR